MRRAFIWIGLGLVVLGATAVAGGFSGSSSSDNGRPAPALPRSVLVGPRVTLSALRGTPTVVNFWASWCEPCKREAPALEAFARGLHGRAQLVGVNWNDEADGARSFVRTYRWTFPNLRDGDGSVGNAYDIVGLPTTFILARNGRIVRRLTGSQSVTSIQAALKGL